MTEHYLSRVIMPCIDYGLSYYSQFHSISGDKNILHKNMPELYKKRCLGSSHGWLIMAEEESPSIFAVDPLESRTRVPLPSLLTFPDILDFNGDEYIQWMPFVGSLNVGSKLLVNNYLKKVVFSKEPTQEGCMAVAIFGVQDELAVCRVGDKEWKIVKGFIDDGTGFRDIVFDHTGEFYAVNVRGTIVAGDPSLLSFYLVYKPPVPDYADGKYLAFDAVGTLMLINRYIGDHDRDEVETNCSDDDWLNGDEVENESGFEEYYGCDSNEEKWKSNDSDYDSDDNEDGEETIEEIKDACSFKTLRFRIFRLDEEYGKLEEIDSLEDEVLFVGDNESLCLSSREFPGCKGDCVYYTDDRLEARKEPRMGGHDIGVFSLKDGSVERFQYVENEDDHGIWPPPIWVALNTTI